MVTVSLKPITSQRKLPSSRGLWRGSNNEWFRAYTLELHSCVCVCVCVCTHACMCTRAPSCLCIMILCNRMNCSLPGSSVHGFLQARRLEWVAISSSRGIFLTHGSNPQPKMCLLHWQEDSLPLEPPGKPAYLDSDPNFHYFFHLLMRLVTICKSQSDLL